MLVNRLGGFVAPFLAIYLTSVRHLPVEEAGLIVTLVRLGSSMLGLGFARTPALIADLAPPELRGSYQGAFQMTWDLGSFMAPLIGAFVLGHAGANGLWAGCSATRRPGGGGP